MVPNDYVDIIQVIRYHRGCLFQPFEVIQEKGSEINDYKVFGEKILKLSLIAIGGETLKIRQVMWFSYGASQEIDFVSGDVVSVIHEDGVWFRYTLYYVTTSRFNPLRLYKRKVQKSRTIKCLGRRYWSRVWQQ